MQINKLRAYVGFAVKSGNIVFGVDQIKACKKQIKLVLACNTLSSNALDKLYRHCSLNNLKLVIIQSPYTLDSIVGRENCKAIAILDEHLAQAIDQIL